MMAIRNLDTHAACCNAVEKPLKLIDPFADLLLDRRGRIQVVEIHSKRFLHANPPIDRHQKLWSLEGPDALTLINNVGAGF
jgi:hypothetical protein